MHIPFGHFFKKVSATLGFALAVSAMANNPLHESDLTNSRSNYDIWSMGPDTQLVPSGQETLPLENNQFEIQILRKWKEKEVKMIPGLTLQLSNGESIQLGAGGNFKAPAFCSGKVSVLVNFETPFFAIGVKSWSSSSNYTLRFELPCTGQTTIWADKGSPLAHVLSIWTIAYTAQVKLKDAVGLEFWNSKIDFNYPGDGAYYSGGTVTLPNGEEWDVVGHELGHGIFDLGNIGRMQGGQHYIDRCYGETLALSEGWASYFSAFLSVALDDKDAKFEFMVPRRAPLRFETIPADVCNGYTNEWRVNGFLWDLIDQNQDAEMMTELFGSAWNLTTGKMASGLKNIRDSLINGGFNADEINRIWEQNSAGGSTPTPPNPFERQPNFGGFEFFDDFINRQ